MQSGISASEKLHHAFNTFTSNPSLFALPITISSESLQPLEAISFSYCSTLTSSLQSLTPHLQPKIPIYLILRKDSSPSSGTDLIAITYVPSTAPVRSKTLFASTRDRLRRDLGLEKFTETLFVTDAEEVLDPKQWDERLAGKSGGGVDTAVLSTEERELQRVKRAEEEERHGTSGRDLMGSGGSGQHWSATGGASSGVKMKTTREAKDAFAALSKDSLNSEGGLLTQFGIDLPTETLELLHSTTGIGPAAVQTTILSGRPTYSFYHYPGTQTILFIYTCPGTSKVKERMVYASSRNGVIEVAKSAGVDISKRLEASDPDDITEQRLQEEAGVSTSSAEAASASTGGRGGFARPKRPGKR